jgi:16S rRNA (uracil1498-N3)-methyltransferase
MPVSRIYQSGALAAGKVQLDEKASHHLSRVLRAATGDAIILFNGDGNEYHAVIQNISKKSVDAEITKIITCSAESPVSISLAQGIARGEKMDFVIQKAVELGVTEIIPVMTERCNVRLDDEREQKRMLHWQAVIISACEQCGRNVLPKIHAPVKLDEWLSSVNADKKFVLSPHVSAKLRDDHDAASIAVLIGPEGGLSEREIEAACTHGFTALNLGPRILRTETAALAALAVIQFQFGDFT